MHQQINHGTFIMACQQEQGRNVSVNENQDVILIGAIQLFWKHSKNISYLNKALEYAKSRKGIRANAVKAFLSHFSGAVMKDNKYASGGKLVTCPDNFEALSTWLEWADASVPEPEYNLAKQQLKVINFLQAQKKVAEEHKQPAMVEMLNQSIVAYAEAQKKAMPAIQAA